MGSVLALDSCTVPGTETDGVALGSVYPAAIAFNWARAGDRRVATGPSNRPAPC